VAKGGSIDLVCAGLSVSVAFWVTQPGMIDISGNGWGVIPRVGLDCCSAGDAVFDLRNIGLSIPEGDSSRLIASSNRDPLSTSKSNSSRSLSM